MIPLLATSLAFVVVFGIFVAALVGLSIYIAVWAIRRDVAGRRRYEAERLGETTEQD